MFVGRPFAYLHIPGVPIYVGEFLLAIGAVEALRLLPSVIRLVSRSTAAKVIVAFGGLAVALLARDVPAHGLLALRDSALWLYAAFALIVATAIIVRPELLRRWLAYYRAALPAFLVWVPVAIAAARTEPFILMVPDSPLHVLQVKPGDLAVFVGSGVAYLWLVDPAGDESDRRRRAALTVMAALGLLVAGTQNRGGFLAAGIAIVGALLTSPARSRLVLVGTGTLVTILAFAAVIDFRVSLGDRDISMDQLGENIVSILDPDAAYSGNLEGTVAWRQRLWDATVDDVMANAPLAGFGFGPNLAARYGFGLFEQLRNPHNSHLTVLARTGVFGALLWALLWAAWSYRLLRMVRRRSYHGPLHMSRLAAWCLVTAAGFLVNAAFDPSLEGPQAGIWLWSVVGVGLAVGSGVRRVTDNAPGPPAGIRVSAAPVAGAAR